MSVFTESPDLDNALVNPANWANEKWVHEQFSWMRANEPLKYLSPEDFDPFWNCKSALADTDVLSSL